MKNVFKNEILSPVGNMSAFYSAIEAGADAIYLGGKMFGARAFSNNFTNDELKYIINYAHSFLVKVYVTCNILIIENEVEDFINYIRFLHQNNVDAVIMQDLGMIDLVHKKFPNLVIHGSTQMNIHNLDGALVASKLGIKRIVLARETPIEVIKEIKEKTNLEIEIFVHGALCVSSSGQCLFARSIGPRSGNRGTCSGCCRLPYDILSKNGVVLNKNKYPLSMKDLMTVDYLDQLIDLKIDSFKIEGRMKSKDYVYYATKLYKEARDNYLNNKIISYNKEYLEKLDTIFTRGYTKGFILHDKELNNDKFSNHQGILIGKVIKVNNKEITIKLQKKVSIHDGIRIVNENFEYGFSLNQYKENNNLITLKVNKQIPNNSLVYKTYSYLIDKEVENIINDKERKIIINFKVVLKENKPFLLVVSDFDNTICLSGSVPLKALKQEIDKKIIIEKISKINNTIYKINKIDIDLDNNLFIPISEINNLKREILNLLTEKRINKYKKEFIEKDYYIKLNDFKKESNYCLYTNNKKYLNNKYKYIYSDNLDNTIIKLPKVIEKYNNYKNKEYLISEIGALNVFNNMITDYSFNVTNSYTVALLHSLGIKRVTLSLELIDSQIEDLINSYKKRYLKNPNLELVIKTHMEVMVIKNNLDKYGNIYYLRDRFNNKYRIIKKYNYYYIYDYKEYKRKLKDDYYFNLGINNLREEYYE